jgi:hypothetical protein
MGQEQASAALSGRRSGGTQMAAVRHELAELEKHFVVVNWDQPGSGKSYYAEKTRDITVDTYIQDGHALTEYLKDRSSPRRKST